MEETSKQSGFLLIASLFVISTMMVIVSFYLSSVTQEIKVASIVDTAPQAYYLAEAGIQDAFWKLANDAETIANFETDPAWSASFTRNDALIPGGSYVVGIENQGLARATITATSTVNVADAHTQRVVRANAFKALADTPITGIAVFANDEIYGAGSNVAVTGGDLFANNDIDLNLFSSWSTNLDARAVGEIDISITSDLAAANTYDASNPPPPSAIAMPQIDFDSEDPASYKSRADQIYTTGEFRQLLHDFPVTTLNGITYVTGNVQMHKGTTLTINGALVADGSVKIGNGYSSEQNPARLIVNKVGSEPSGILAKGSITIGGFNSDVDIAGLVYSGAELRVQDSIVQNVTLDVVGGIIVQNLNILVAWQPITIAANQTYIDEALGAPVFSQVLIIDHWEEEY